MSPLLKIERPGADKREQSIIRAAQQGDRASFDALSRTYAPALRGFLLRRVGPSAAEDVLQDALLAAWTGLPQYRGQARFKSWLYAISSRKCADWHRQRGKAAEVPLAEAAGLPDDWTDNAAASERKQILRRALTQIPDIQREIVELYYDAELTLAEIALALERNVNTVKYQFYRAHALLERELLIEPGREPNIKTNEPRAQAATARNEIKRKGPALR